MLDSAIMLNKVNIILNFNKNCIFYQRKITWINESPIQRTSGSASRASCRNRRCCIKKILTSNCQIKISLPIDQQCQRVAKKCLWNTLRQRLHYVYIYLLSLPLTSICHPPVRLPVPWEQCSCLLETPGTVYNSYMYTNILITSKSENKNKYFFLK